MVEKKAKKLIKVANELNVGISTIVGFLGKKGHAIGSNPNTKISNEWYELLLKEFKSEKTKKEESQKLGLKQRDKKGSISIEDKQKETFGEEEEDPAVSSSTEDVFIVQDNRRTPEAEKKGTANKKEAPTQEEAPQEDDTAKVGINVVGKIDLNNISKSPAEATPKAEKEEEKEKEEEPKQQPEVIPEKEKTEKILEGPVAEPEEKKEAPETVKQEKTEKEEIKEPEASPEPKVEKPKPITEEKPVKEEKLQEKPQDKPKEKQPEEVAKEEVAKEEIQEEEKKVNKPKEVLEQKQKPVQAVKKEKKKTTPEVEKEKATPKEQPQKQEKPVGKVEKPIELKESEKGNESSSQEDNLIKTKFEKLAGPTVVGKIDLNQIEPKKKPVASSSEKPDRLKKKKKKRRRIKEKEQANAEKDTTKRSDKVLKKANKDDSGRHDRKRQSLQKKQRRPIKKEVNEEDVQQQIKETLARLTAGKQKNKGAKHRKLKREIASKKHQEEVEEQERQKNILKVTEFVSVNELATMMNVLATEVIAKCMELGMFVSINQRLDAETIVLVSEEFGYEIEFVSVDIQESTIDEEDKEEDLKPRPPIVTVMGHVDHGKTALLDYIRKTNVIQSEAGGITQHIGAYTVKLDGGRRITFLDTPGHQAFTAMRARGAQITDIAIIVIAADDDVMPQTIEAINHAQAASVPIVFAINKIDKPSASAEKIKEQLANMNLLVEEWGGKHQSQDISAKQGMNIEALLEKVMLEAEMLELKAHPDKKAVGSVIEASLDKGRGYVATLLVQAGQLNMGDIILAGSHTGRVKAMYNEKNEKVKYAGPSTPVLVLGLNGAPQAGDEFKVFENEREAREIANKREQLLREQGLRARKHITLDEIGRRIAIGSFKELNVIVKGDVIGSIEALTDSLVKLSTEEIQVNVIHKAVGQISESDVMLATASNAIIIGFQVRPSVNARKLAESEGIDIRLYSVIYDAIDELKDAMEGMLSPEIKEQITGSAEIREVFKISKVGTIAGCIVKDGTINRNEKVRVIREGIVVYTGDLASLKRFKDDVKEVKNGFECGLGVSRFNDLKVGDIIEAFEESEVKRQL